MKLAMGADHRGLASAKSIADRLQDDGHELLLFFGCEGEPCDYPEPAYKVGNAIATGQAERGILICGSGIGMSIAANKVSGIRAALVHDELTAEMSRSHNDANIVCVSSDLLGRPLIEKIVEIWLQTPFSGGRHQRRVAKITAIEQGVDPATADVGRGIRDTGDGTTWH